MRRAVKELVQEHRWSLIAVYIIILAVVIFSFIRLETLINEVGDQADEIQHHQRQLAVLSVQNRRLIKANKHLSVNTDIKICVRINNLNKTVTQALLRQKRAVGRIAYYQDHPSDKKLALDEINHQLKQFAPRQCDGDIQKG